MKTMRAIVFQEEKNFDSMQIKEIPFPEPKAGEAVVEIKASALNHRDVWIIEKHRIIGSIYYYCLFA